MNAEDVDVFIGYGEGISSDERPDLIDTDFNEDWFYGG